MSRIHDRLQKVRDQHDLSLRAFAEAVEVKTGYEVSHSAVGKYEKDGQPPAEYVRAVAETFSVSVQWLLGGEERQFPDASLAIRDLRDQLETLLARMPESASPAEVPAPRSPQEVSAEWEEVVRTWNRDGSPSPLVLRSHERSAEAGVPEEAEEVSYHRVDDEELEQRRSRNRELIEAATPHLQWLSALLGTVEHVVYLTDPEGVILTYEGNQERAREWHLTPGHDWSEQRMGTNGAGTALQAGRPVAVIGDEHYNQAFRDVTCLGVPIRDADGDLRGAIDVAIEKQFGCPGRLLPAVYAGWGIERALR